MVTAVTVAAASAPAIMVTAAAAAHMSAPMPMALHLDHGVVLRDASRCDSEPCRSRRGQRKGRGHGRDCK
jgi:fructose/tagatose bisphosphate aldolase